MRASPGAAGVAGARGHEIHARYADPHVAWMYAEANSRGVNVPQAAPCVARKVTADVLDVVGRRVRVLAERAAYAPGRYSLRLERGRLPAGLYLVRLNAGEFGQRRRLVVLE